MLLNRPFALAQQVPEILIEQDDCEMLQDSDIGSHLVKRSTLKEAASNSTANQDSTMINSSLMHLSQLVHDFGMQHPSAHLSRKTTTDMERQNINIKSDYAEQIERYTRYLEQTYLTENCLDRHKITRNLRARMIDWMIEVLTNFKCDD
jgi:hypothetical protein